MLLIDDIFLLGFLVLVVGCATAFILKVKPFPMFFWSLVYIYFVVVLGLTLFPIPYQEAGSLFPAPHNVIPLHTIISILKSGIALTPFVQLVGNILISVPYGVTLGLATRKKNKRLFLLAFLFPLVIECLQFLIGLCIGLSYRSFDVDDFILNIFGVYLGILITRMLSKKLRDEIFRKLFSKQAAK